MIPSTASPHAFSTETHPTPPPAMLGSLLASFDGLVYRCLIDASWTMQFMSAGCLTLTGRPAEHFINNLRIAYEDIVVVEDRAWVRAEIMAAVHAERRFSVEYRIMHTNGAIRWVWEHGIGVRDAQGRYTALEGFIQDVTQRRHAELALQEAERRFRSLFENAIEGIFQSTADKGYLAVNPALAHMYGYGSPEEMISELRDIDHQLYVEPERRAEFLALMVQQGAVKNFESQVYRRDGKILWISENARAVRDAHGEILFFEGTVIDITQRKRYEEKIRHQATHDALTGLPNRHLLHDRLEQAMRKAQRHGHMVAVAFIDLDQFKFVNDSLGHQIGDALLKAVASRLAGCMRVSDTVARLGGDEFVLALDNQRSLDSVTECVRRVIVAVAEPWSARGLHLHVTCSIGISVYPNDAHTADSLLRNADSAMYKAKEQGRNNFQYYAAEMNLNATARLELLNGLRRAISNEEFQLHYQPRVQLATGKIIGAEALIRWQRGSHGMVGPNCFIPLAEDSGLILAIGEWVLRAACRQGMAWQRAGLPSLPVAVNLSTRQLASDNFVQQVACILAETGLAPHCLELEITESQVMRDVDKSLQKLKELKRLGVMISIDDFGTGYSSLSYLKRFPVDTLKIDRSFVKDIASNADDAAIAKAVISLAHILNLQVVAEGVETAEQKHFLLENGCDEVQGFYFGAPMTAEAFAAHCLRA